MEADHQLLRESLLPAAGEREAGDDDDAVVRVVLNPSMLDRFLRGDRYYFYDDAPVPYEAILRGGDDLPLLPSRKARLLREKREEDCGEGEVFGYLWMRLCARLAAARVDNFRREGPRLCLLGSAWSLGVLFLAAIVAAGSDAASVVSFSVLAAVDFRLLSARLAPPSEREVQEIVDEMGPHFAGEGFLVDLVPSSPMHVRIERVGEGEGGGPRPSSSLGESMARFQERARREYQDAALDRRQARLRELGAGTAWIFGVPVDALAEWKTTIVGLTVVLGFVYLASTAMTFLGVSVFWGRRGLYTSVGRLQGYGSSSTLEMVVH